MKRSFVHGACIVAAASILAAGTFVGTAVAHDDRFNHFEFQPHTLVLSRSVYTGTPSTVAVGQTLPPGCVPGTITLPLLAGGTTTVVIPSSAVE